MFTILILLALAVGGYFVYRNNRAKVNAVAAKVEATATTIVADAKTAEADVKKL